MSVKKLVSSMSKVISLPLLGQTRESVLCAAQLISLGHVLAVPTDTVYGLACDAQNAAAVSQLYAIKGRTQDNPISICVGRIEAVKLWAEVDHLPPAILDSLLPGPVTLVFKRSGRLNPLLNPHSSKVGVRIPESEFVRDLANCSVSALALTSANTSGQTSSLEVSEFRHLWHMLGAVFDAGKLGELREQRQGSTVVDLSIPGRFSVLRPGVAYANTTKILENFGLVDAYKLREVGICDTVSRDVKHPRQQ
uniref:Threonylcarbamoyl-AMP synthase n=2 Tax=Timema TaxID=61471 RepID=A0A7R9HM11_9NEOP|nr:unnamed protein product [Timema monikensis]